VTILSTHVLDIELGKPAAGVPIALFQGDWQLAQVETNVDGRVLDVAGGAIDPGFYRLVFDVAAYLSATGRAAPFLQRVSIDFHVAADAAHYHVPLLLSQYACTSYRGS
jgi:5-hydroxyisourate hydrolase